MNNNENIQKFERIKMNEAVKKVLVVDDEPVNLRIIENIFDEDPSVKLMTVESGERALDVIPSFLPDVILLDIMMPNMNGYEVCKKIRAHKEFRFIKTIIVSAKAMLNERLMGYDMGADDYITKPFDEQELRAKVNVFLKFKSSEEVNSLKGFLLHLISHELRTPLNGILGFASILNQSKSLSECEKAHINVILESGRQLLEFSQKAILLCELKQDFKLYKEPVSIGDLLGSILRKLQVKALEATVEFNFVKETHQKLMIDFHLMENAFRFVLENAIKYSPVNGVITLTLLEVDDCCLLSIKDMGEGLDSSRFNYIFEEFSIGDIEHHHSGQGLSLSIAKKIVRMHQGDLLVRSTPGNGANFVFCFPLGDVTVDIPSVVDRYYQNNA